MLLLTHRNDRVHTTALFTNTAKTAGLYVGCGAVNPSSRWQTVDEGWSKTCRDRVLGDRGLVSWLIRLANQRRWCSGKLQAHTQRRMTITFADAAWNELASQSTRRGTALMRHSWAMTSCLLTVDGSREVEIEPPTLPGYEYHRHRQTWTSINAALRVDLKHLHMYL